MLEASGSFSHDVSIDHVRRPQSSSVLLSMPVLERICLPRPSVWTFSVVVRPEYEDHRDRR